MILMIVPIHLTRVCVWTEAWCGCVLGAEVNLFLVRLSYQLRTVRPGCLSTRPYQQTLTTYQQDLINRDRLSTSLMVGKLLLVKFPDHIF
jgi:hypothetical protein